MNLKKIKRLNFFKEQSINNLLRIVLSSFLMISFFYITPILLMFSEKNFNNKEFTNNSKKILAYTLNNGSKNQDENINENDLLFDIFSLNDLETDTVRLSASTIRQTRLCSAGGKLRAQKRLLRRLVIWRNYLNELREKYWFDVLLKAMPHAVS